MFFHCNNLYKYEFAKILEKKGKMNSLSAGIRPRKLESRGQLPITWGDICVFGCPEEIRTYAEHYLGLRSYTRLTEQHIREIREDLPRLEYSFWIDCAIFKFVSNNNIPRDHASLLLDQVQSDVILLESAQKFTPYFRPVTLRGLANRIETGEWRHIAHRCITDYQAEEIKKNNPLYCS